MEVWTEIRRRVLTKELEPTRSMCEVPRGLAHA